MPRETRRTIAKDRRCQREHPALIGEKKAAEKKDGRETAAEHG